MYWKEFFPHFDKFLARPSFVEPRSSTRLREEAGDSFEKRKYSPNTQELLLPKLPKPCSRMLWDGLGSWDGPGWPQNSPGMTLE